MGPNRVLSVKKINIFVFLAGCFTSSCCIHEGVVQVKHPNPKVIKASQNTPVYIKLKSLEHPQGVGELLMLQGSQAKPITMKMCKRVSRSILGAPKLPLVPYLVSLIPKHSILPLFPNWLPKPKPTVGLPDVLSPSPIAKLSRMVGWTARNAQIHEKLLELRRKGSLSSSEFIRFTNLLMKL